jgi:hypothetical protein
VLCRTVQSYNYDEECVEWSTACFVNRVLCNDFSVAKGLHQACVVSDLRALPTGLLNSSMNVIGELLYNMNFCFLN